MLDQVYRPDARNGGATKQDFRSVAVERPIEITGVAHCFMCNTQRQELLRISTTYAIRHDAELQRIKVGQLADKPAPPTVNPPEVRRIPPGIKTGIPLAERCLAYAVDAADDVVPICGQVRCTGKQARHTDNGYSPAFLASALPLTRPAHLGVPEGVGWADSLSKDLCPIPDSPSMNS